MTLSTPAHLLTLEVGGGYDLLEEERFESHEKAPSEEIVIISGTIIVSP